MQRFSGGLKVPQIQLDKFSGETTTAASQITLTLTYTPKSRDHIQVQLGYDGAYLPLRLYIESLTGKDLLLLVGRERYNEADAVTGGTISGGGGIDPHDHAVTTTSADIDIAGYAVQAVPPVIVSYEVG